ncbi:hypothetical protein DL96DRAFT_1712343 [Flagelloscypha sp. PMI_526]|nr:hypothetical protein DL96DRAFT_1712343 [Flagelloscypha sp. PMI_526]
MPLTFSRAALRCVRRSSCSSRRSYALLNLKPPEGSIFRKLDKDAAKKLGQDIEEETDSPPPSAPSDDELVLAYKDRVPTRPDHPLYRYFNQRTSTRSLLGEELRVDGEHKWVTLPSTVENMPQAASGRAWRTHELRLKSFEDLHVLWYLNLRERNIMATQRDEALRLAKTNRLSNVFIGYNALLRRNSQITMRRIKVVLNERRRAYDGALELLRTRQEAAQDDKVLAYKRAKFGKPLPKDSKRRWSDEEKVVHALVRERQVARKTRKWRKKSDKVAQERAARLLRMEKSSQKEPDLLSFAGGVASVQQAHV